MASRWRRGLTADEEALWSHVTRAIRPRASTSLTPVDPDPVAHEAHPPAPCTPATPQAAPAPAMPPDYLDAFLKAGVGSRSAAKPPATLTRAPKPLPTPRTKRGHVEGLDRRTSDRLKKGALEPEARIDLHGMRQDEAHGALDRFVTAAAARGLRCVLVVTGKGQRTDDREGWSFLGAGERGVLRRLVPQWLAQPPLRALVTAAIPAARQHGGEGAMYIYLKRGR